MHLCSLLLCAQRAQRPKKRLNGQIEKELYLYFVKKSFCCCYFFPSFLLTLSLSLGRLLIFMAAMHSNVPWHSHSLRDMQLEERKRSAHRVEPGRWYITYWEKQINNTKWNIVFSLWRCVPVPYRVVCALGPSFDEREKCLSKSNVLFPFFHGFCTLQNDMSMTKQKMKQIACPIDAWLRRRPKEPQLGRRDFLKCRSFIIRKFCLHIFARKLIVTRKSLYWHICAYVASSHLLREYHRDCMQLHSARLLWRCTQLETCRLAFAARLAFGGGVHGQRSVNSIFTEPRRPHKIHTAAEHSFWFIKCMQWNDDKSSGMD